MYSTSFLICILCNQFCFIRQNNDKHKPKHDSGPQDVLQLNQEQIQKVLDLALAEAASSSASSSLDNDEDQRPLNVLKSRIPLIVSCLNTTEKAQKAMDYLQGKYNNVRQQMLMLPFPFCTRWWAPFSYANVLLLLSQQRYNNTKGCQPFL